MPLGIALRSADSVRRVRDGLAFTRPGTGSVDIVRSSKSVKRLLALGPRNTERSSVHPYTSRYAYVRSASLV